MPVPGDADYVDSSAEEEEAVLLEFMWGDVGLFGMNRAAKKNPLRWTSGHAGDIMGQLRAKEGKDSRRPVLIRIQGSGNNGRDFACAADAAAWVERCFLDSREAAAQQPDTASGRAKLERQGITCGPSKGMTVAIGVSGWLSSKRDNVQRHWRFLPTDLEGSEAHALQWESGLLADVGGLLSNTAKGFAKTQLGKSAAGAVIGSAAVASMAMPMAVVGLSNLLTNPWVMAIDRADKAGGLLANALLQREHGCRPVLFFGWSLGARLIFSCLEKLSQHGEAGRGIVDSAFLLGCPVDAAPERWGAASSVVAHRLVNGFKHNDKILSLSRAFAGSKGTLHPLAGLGPVAHPAVENVDVGEFVQTHMNYRTCARDIFARLGVHM